MTLFFLCIFTITTAFAGGERFQKSKECIEWVEAKQVFHEKEIVSQNPTLPPEKMDYPRAWFSWGVDQGRPCIKYHVYGIEQGPKYKIKFFINGEKVSVARPAKARLIKNSCFDLFYAGWLDSGVFISEPGIYRLEIEICPKGEQSFYFQERLNVELFQVWLIGVCQENLGDTVTLQFEISSPFPDGLKRGDIVELSINNEFIGESEVFFKTQCFFTAKIEVEGGQYDEFKTRSLITIFDFYDGKNYLGEVEIMDFYYWSPSPC